MRHSETNTLSPEAPSELMLLPFFAGSEPPRSDNRTLFHKNGLAYYEEDHRSVGTLSEQVF